MIVEPAIAMELHRLTDHVLVHQVLLEPLAMIATLIITALLVPIVWPQLLAVVMGIAQATGHVLAILVIMGVTAPRIARIPQLAILPVDGAQAMGRVPADQVMQDLHANIAIA